MYKGTELRKRTTVSKTQNNSDFLELKVGALGGGSQRESKSPQQNVILVSENDFGLTN